jgi:RNA polymerase sigma factor (sigma-70 family)
VYPTERSNPARGGADQSPDSASRSSERDVERSYLNEIGSLRLLLPAEEIALASELRGCADELTALLESVPRAARALGSSDDPAEIDALVRRLSRWLPRLDGAERSADAVRLARLERRLGVSAPLFRDVMKRVLEAQRRRQSLRNTFVRHNLRLVVSMAYRYRGLGVPLLDLVQEGNMGLMRAVDRFAPEHGARFSTYASWWVRQALTRAVQKQARLVRLPVQVEEQLWRWRRAGVQLSARLGRAPSERELVDEARVEGRSAQELGLLGLEPISLDAPFGDGDERSFADRLADPGAADPSDSTELAHFAGVIERAIGRLDARERAVIERRFGLGAHQAQTLRAIGADLGVSRQRVAAIETRALAKLRRWTRVAR